MTVTRAISTMCVQPHRARGDDRPVSGDTVTTWLALPCAGIVQTQVHRSCRAKPETPLPPTRCDQRFGVDRSGHHPSTSHAHGESDHGLTVDGWVVGGAGGRVASGLISRLCRGLRTSTSGTRWTGIAGMGRIRGGCTAFWRRYWGPGSSR